MRIIDSMSPDDNSIIYSVSLVPGLAVDVKVYENTGLIYVMQNEDGSSVHDETFLDYTFPGFEYDEAAVTQYVRDFHNKSKAPFKVFDLDFAGNIYHVGTMDISQKRSHSYEGNGLSVSNCPDEWIQITDGFTFGDYFLLSKPDAKFLDYYSLTDKEKEMIQVWAIEKGFVVEGSVYKSLSWGENGEEYFSLYDSYKAALEEADYEEEYVEEIAGLLPTQKLIEQSLVKIELLNVRDIITAFYAEQVLDYDGIWWDEELDVYAYSAPRGVIFNNKLPSFDVVNISKEKEKTVSLDDMLARASAKVKQQAQQGMKEMDKNISFSDSER